MSDAPPDKITPMLRQYLDLKSRYADALLLFQMGDFYETFFEDAEKAAGALNIALTSRSRAGEDRIPMAGFPIHAADGYISRLLEQGFKVVVCDQTEDPAQAKGLVRREVTRILTRGTVVDPGALDARADNYLAAVATRGRKWGLAFLELSTGEFRLTEGEGPEALGDELWRLKPVELLVPEDLEAGAAHRGPGALRHPAHPAPALALRLRPGRGPPGGGPGPGHPVPGRLRPGGRTAWGWPPPGPSCAISRTPTPRTCPTWTGCCPIAGTITWGWTKPPCGTWRSSRPGAAAPARARSWRPWTTPSPPWGPGGWPAGCAIP